MAMKKTSGGDSPLRQGAGKSLWTLPIFIAKIVHEGLPTYWTLTKVRVGDGKHTSFWQYNWHSFGVLSVRFEVLFLQCTRPNASVFSVVTEGLSLCPRLSSAAALELEEVGQLLPGISLGSSLDSWSLAWGKETTFSSRAAYMLMAPGRVLDESACLARSSSLPTKLKIFVYLMAIDRLSSRGNLFHKNCAPTSDCATCSSEETSRHLFFDCPRAAAVWDTIGVHIPTGEVNIWRLHSPVAVPVSAWHASLAVILWHVWKARNDVVFNSVSCQDTIVLRWCVADIAVWTLRFKAADRAALEAMRSFILSVRNKQLVFQRGQRPQYIVHVHV
jgi:hypothetical protein